MLNCDKTKRNRNNPQACFNPFLKTDVCFTENIRVLCAKHTGTLFETYGCFLLCINMFIKIFSLFDF